MKKICFSMTAPSALRAFMADHVRALAAHYDVTVFCNFSADPCEDLFDPSITLVHMPFARQISPWQDLKCGILLVRALRRGGFDSVHSVMPKTGLLSMFAGRLARVPVRIHMFTGQVWVTRTSFWRAFLKMMDRIIAWCATDVYADSPSQRDFLVAEKVIGMGTVLCDGSVNGVDCDRFKPDVTARASVRERFGIPAAALVFGFMGRLNRDKGIVDLVEAFAAADIGAAHLVLAGPDENDIEAMVRERFPAVLDRVHFAGYTSCPESVYPAFDVFCLPSYREGFGSSAIEAAACGVPALASRIYGLTDAIAEGRTGLMHEPRDVAGIQAGLERFAADGDMRDGFSANARRRAMETFATRRLVEAMLNEYGRLLGDV